MPDTPSSLSRWGLLPGLTVHAADGRLIVETPRLRLSFNDSEEAVSRVLLLLSRGGQRWDDLLDQVEGLERVAAVDFLLTQLRRRGLLTRTILFHNRPLATLIPLAHAGLDRPQNASSPRRVSRFAHARQDEEGWVLETPLAPFRVRLHDWRGLALLAGGAVDLDEQTASAFHGLLADAGVYDEDPPYWEFHDLVFHAGSRLGRHDRPYGGTYPYRGVSSSPPAVKDAMSAGRVALPRPDLECLRRSDPPFAGVVETRRSIRVHGDPPISLAQLGEFLWRTWRNGALRHDGDQELGRRPHPNAGALYELECYLIVTRAEGLDAGAYHYDPSGHALEVLHVARQDCVELTDFARRGSGMTTPPQVFITMTSRFGRLAWKYRSIAYAATLKDVGILTHQMYLAATAMGLAPCALGGGDSDRFARAFGLDYYEEPAVGEFMLGTA
jgi:SagB-type dehydrogenase family enzyme